MGYTHKFSGTPDTENSILENKRISKHLKDILLVELALLQYYGVITTLPFCRYSSPILAKQKPNGKLRILVEHRKINMLIQNDNNNNFPIATLADVGTYFGRKKLFCKVDRSHGYFSVQIADKK